MKYWLFGAGCLGRKFIKKGQVPLENVAGFVDNYSSDATVGGCRYIGLMNSQRN